MQLTDALKAVGLYSDTDTHRSHIHSLNCQHRACSLTLCSVGSSFNFHRSQCPSYVMMKMFCNTLKDHESFKSWVHITWPTVSLMWLVLSIDCLQKCDTAGAALLSTCWRRYKPPSPFITPLNFMVFTILSTPCYLFKDFRFWCLYQLCFTVYYHVDVCVVTWEHGSVNLWHPGVSWNPPQPQAGTC